MSQPQRDVTPFNSLFEFDLHSDDNSSARLGLIADNYSGAQIDLSGDYSPLFLGGTNLYATIRSFVDSGLINANWGANYSVNDSVSATISAQNDELQTRGYYGLNYNNGNLNANVSKMEGQHPTFQMMYNDPSGFSFGASAQKGGYGLFGGYSKRY
jgi:hypothetical protein